MHDQRPHATLEPVRYGEFLLHRSKITDEQWLEALAEHWSAATAGYHRRIGTWIVDNGFLDQDALDAEARMFHDEIDVVEVSSTRPRSEQLTVPPPYRS